MPMSHEIEMVTRLVVAAGLGSLIGADRERLVWAAGLRTHMLVSVGACLFMIVSAFGFSEILKAPNVVLDPSRIAAQVVSGIGFLGAGSILLRGEIVRGLTTAASLWTVAAIGLAVGGGLYIEAVAATIVILLILAGIKPLEERFQRRAQTHEIRIKAQHGTMSTEALSQILGYRSRRIARYTCTQTENAGIDEIVVTFNRIGLSDIAEIVEKIRAIPTVADVSKQSI